MSNFGILGWPPSDNPAYDVARGAWATEEAIHDVARQLDGLEWRIFELEDMDRQEDADEYDDLRKPLELRLADLRAHLDYIEGGAW